AAQRGAGLGRHRRAAGGDGPGPADAAGPRPGARQQAAGPGGGTLTPGEVSMNEPTLPARDDAGPLSPAQRAAALRAEQRQRWQAGERVPAEHYLGVHPELRGDPEAAVDLIFNEFLLREGLGERPGKEEFLRRFPEHAVTVAEQIDLHRAMSALGGTL